MSQAAIAKKLAQQCHKKEFRRDGKTPYFHHISTVVSIVVDRYGMEDKLLAVAYLHDTIESGYTQEMLKEEGVDDDVVEAIKLLTLNRELTYLDNIRKIKASRNRLAISVKIADNLANLSDFPTNGQILKYSKSLQILLAE